MSTRVSSRHSRPRAKYILMISIACLVSAILTYIVLDIYDGTKAADQPAAPPTATVTPTPAEKENPTQDSTSTPETSAPSATETTTPTPPTDLHITEDYRAEFNHGVKTAQYQKYIVLHDTEVDSSATAIANAWQSQGTYVAAHFIVQKDGTVLQVVPMDAIAHHAGFGDTGHNALYGVSDESRDDRRGTQPIGSWASDYGMNSYSIGIEMVHVSGTGYYPPEQLEAVDKLIAYIDSYYGFESQIIDHKAWRSGNSDTSPEFAGYFANYKDHRTHN